MVSRNIINIFKTECNYSKINEANNVKLRNTSNGLTLADIFFYRFSYSDKYTTKDQIVSKINNINGTKFTRQGFDGKENNISITTYENIFKLIYDYYCQNYVHTTDSNLVAVDGTYNNNKNMDEMLNMGFYNVSNGIPLNITSFGVGGKNKEIKSATEYITNYINTFKNTVIVGDRGYFSYAFIDFLIMNNLKFIIRAKGDAINLDPSKTIKKTTPQYDLIMNIRDKVRIIKYEDIQTKIIYTSNSKKKIKKHVVEIKNDCVIVSNLLDDKIYSSTEILNMYKSRWDIEVFFKYIKYNYKFQHVKEKYDAQYKKMYICELIITYIAKIVEKYYINKFKNNTKVKINKSNLIRGIFSSLLYDIIYEKLTDDKLDQFCRSYIKIIINTNNRSFPRTSKTPFTKWYVKGYSNQTKYMSIIDAIINNTVNELNKNLKSLAHKIVTIDKSKCEI